MTLKFHEIVSKNAELGKTITSPEYEVVVLSNITINQLNPVLEYTLRTEGINARCQSGGYDNIVQDSEKFSTKKLTVIFWELSNLIDGFQYKANLLSQDAKEQYIQRFRSEIDLVFSHLAQSPLVIVNAFSSMVFNSHNIQANNLDRICQDLNDYLAKKRNPNTIIIDIERILAQLSIEKSVDFRNYYSSKSLYTVDFLKAYAEYIKPIVMSVAGKSKKVLVFDCDNTLWDGIVGEDGIEGIHMSGSSPKGVVYEEVQSIAKDLAAKGIILCLNSRNNRSDVDEVFQKHKGMSLSEKDIVITKINWNDKATNMKEIARELNVGIDSFVFVDDSDFEINFVNELTPSVTTIQVPQERYLYPETLRSKLHLFHNNSESKEDRDRVTMYRQELSRESEKSAFGSIEEYLRSLELSVRISIDNKGLIPRLAQLTQKTNQFNLTTERRSEAEMRTIVGDPGYKVFALDVKDKFGAFGVTGLAILEISGREGFLSTLLMSCRVLGRNVELKFVDSIIEWAKKTGLTKMKAEYRKTERNVIVEKFLEEVGFTVTKQDALSKSYELILESYQYHPLDYVEVTYE